MHDVKVVNVRERTAKSSGNTQLVLELEATEGEHKGKTVRGYITLVPESEGFLYYFVRAAFPEIEDYDEFVFESDGLVGREVRIEVEWPDHAEVPHVSRYYPV
jgi:hypothetical protein